MIAIEQNSAPAGSTDWRNVLRHRAIALPTSLALVALIAASDYLTGYELRLAFLYFAPIALATWVVGRMAGLFTAMVAATGWLLTFQTVHNYSHDFYFYWEGALTAASYVIFVLLLARLREALAHSDDRFVTVLEGLDAAVCVEDPRSGEVLLANSRFRDTHWPARPWAATEPAPTGGEIHDAATQRWYLLNNRPLRWIDGRPVTLRMLSEITEQKRARELVARRRDAGHRASRLVALGEFASAMAHELNQPLAAIATYNDACVRMLDAGGSDSGQLRQAMEKCREQARRAGTIMQRLRELIRRPGPVPVMLDLNEVARSALSLAEPEAAEAGVAVQFVPDPRPLPVLADRVLIEQVVLNFLRNAIEATPPDMQAPRSVTVVTAARPGERALLMVSDRGVGVPADVAPRLFEPLVTTKPSGLGLGLSICRSIVEAHGGNIGYTPAPGGGSAFEFTLPGRRA